MIRAFLFSLFAFPVFANECTPGRYTYDIVVQSVYDGDTIRADIDLGFTVWMRNQPLRLYGVNTPEVRGAERERGLTVRDAVRAWIDEAAGQRMWINSIQDREGKFGRYLAIICIQGWERSLNHRLLAEDMAVLAPYGDDEATVRELLE